MLQKFLIDYCDAYEYDVAGLIENEIKKFEVKHNKTMKIPKFTLQLYSFLYDCLMDFPKVKFDEIKTITTNGFMINLHRIINYKVHIHHSHITGEIIGHEHDFCNLKMRENNIFIPLIGHNFLGFGISYMVKGFRSSVWGTDELRMGGKKLINMNFANISTQVKIIDTLKYYQTSLANISSTVTVEEKKNIEETVDLYLKKHSYFSNIWQSLDQNNKNKILETISKGKGAIPYEKIVATDSLDIVPEKEFFEHTEFYGKLNGCNIPFEVYEDMKFLYKTLKMRKLGDMNDLYNMQDVILLCEIIENRFEKMNKIFGFNPRKCNSASTLSGCIQRNQSKVIIALPTNYSHAEIFEKIPIGGFTCVNNRIGFDTEVLLPNFNKVDYSKINIDESFKVYKNQNYKVGYNIKLDDDELSSQRRVISKIIKFDENNQYGFAMTKPVPVGTIKLLLFLNYYFDQERCKKNFILMNQKARQEATDKIESDFCKLPNNANFGYDCRNNLDNCTFDPITDEIRELNFIKRYHSNLYGENLRQFITSRVLSENIQERYNNERQLIKEDDKFYAAKIRSLENRRHAKIESLEAFKRKEKKHHKKTGLYFYVDRLDVANKNDKIKSIIDFSDQDTASIKALAIKKTKKLK